MNNPCCLYMKTITSLLFKWENFGIVSKVARFLFEFLRRSSWLFRYVRVRHLPPPAAGELVGRGTSCWAPDIETIANKYYWKLAWYCLYMMSLFHFVNKLVEGDIYKTTNIFLSSLGWIHSKTFEYIEKTFRLENIKINITVQTG